VNQVVKATSMYAQSCDTSCSSISALRATCVFAPMKPAFKMMRTQQIVLTMVLFMTFASHVLL